MIKEGWLATEKSAGNVKLVRRRFELAETAMSEGGCLRLTQIVLLMVSK